MVDVIINNQTLDGGPDGINYIKQANDLADVTTVNTSYSYTLEFPKNPKNTLIFKGLGLEGNLSRIPYEKSITQIIDNGAMIVSNGRATVKETSTSYKVIVQDGIIDFFRAIENKTIGGDLDLTSLEHVKTDVNIIASFTNPNYRYLISEYNGWTWKSNVLNPDYQIPSINNQFIFDKIMDFAGYTYEGLPDISGEWTTFPTPPTIPTDEEELRFQGQIQKEQNIPEFQNWKPLYVPEWTTISFYDTDFLMLENNWYLKGLQTGNYKAEFSSGGGGSRMLYGVTVGNQLYTQWLPIKWSLYLNSVKLASSYLNQTTNFLFPASANNRIHFFPETLTR